MSNAATDSTKSATVAAAVPAQEAILVKAADTLEAASVAPATVSAARAAATSRLQRHWEGDGLI